MHTLHIYSAHTISPVKQKKGCRDPARMTLVWEYALNVGGSAPGHVPNRISHTSLLDRVFYQPGPRKRSAAQLPIVFWGQVGRMLNPEATYGIFLWGHPVWTCPSGMGRGPSWSRGPAADLVLVWPRQTSTRSEPSPAQPQT